MIFNKNMKKLNVGFGNLKNISTGKHLINNSNPAENPLHPPQNFKPSRAISFIPL